MKHRLAGALRKTQIQDPIKSASTPSDAHGNGVNGHALNHRATMCASIPGDAHENGHALNLRATICASIPSDAQGNGRALNHRKISALNQTTRWKNQKWAIDQRRGGMLTLFVAYQF